MRTKETDAIIEAVYMAMTTRNYDQLELLQSDAAPAVAAVLANLGAADAAERVRAVERENAELRELASRLLAAAEYYEPHKASWSEADEEHDEAISEARDALGPRSNSGGTGDTGS
jgi:thymidylate synthase ThyX